MRIRVAVVVFLFLSACSVASMKLPFTPETKPVAFDGGGCQLHAFRTLFTRPIEL